MDLALPSYKQAPTLDFINDVICGKLTVVTKQDLMFSQAKPSEILPPKFDHYNLNDLVEKLINELPHDEKLGSDQD